MRLAYRDAQKAPGRQYWRCPAVEGLAGGHAESAGNHSHMLLLGMTMWRYLVAGREFQPNNELAFFRRIAVQHRDLGAGRQRRRSRLEHHVVDGDGGMMPLVRRASPGGRR
jgi:hypothetical protein